MIMKVKLMKTVPAHIAAIGLAAGVMLGASVISQPAMAAGGGVSTPHMQKWSFGGVFGRFDRAQLKRGLQVYRESCAACHGLKRVAFRTLSQPGGPELTEDEVKELAAEYEIKDGPDDEGEMYDRPGLPKDYFTSPHPNDNAARAANNGALPPDLSIITKARGYHRGFPGWFIDLFTGYQEAGADYLYALLTGYEEEAPEGFNLVDGMSYNHYFAGHQIAMPPPLSDELVEYGDGTKATVDQMAKDITAFLMWTAEPTLEQRKRLGFQVFLFVLLLTGLMYFTTKRLWHGVKH